MTLQGSSRDPEEGSNVALASTDRRTQQFNNHLLRHKATEILNDDNTFSYFDLVGSAIQDDSQRHLQYDQAFEDAANDYLKVSTQIYDVL